MMHAVSRMVARLEYPKRAKPFSQEHVSGSSIGSAHYNAGQQKSLCVCCKLRGEGASLDKRTRPKTR